MAVIIADEIEQLFQRCFKELKMAASRAMKFGNHIKEIRIHLCQNSKQSQGVRDFIEQHYVSLKQSNPRFPILIRECSGVQPRIYARYALGKESSVSLTNLKAEDVMNHITTMAKC